MTSKPNVYIFAVRNGGFCNWDITPSNIFWTKDKTEPTISILYLNYPIHVRTTNVTRCGREGNVILDDREIKESHKYKKATNNIKGKNEI